MGFGKCESVIFSLRYIFTSLYLTGSRFIVRAFTTLNSLAKHEMLKSKLLQFGISNMKFNVNDILYLRRMEGQGG